MRCVVLVLVATLASCASGVTGASEVKSVALGETFGLKIGESAQIEGEALQIGFEDVLADSRCPKGEHCIWEGDATVRVWMQMTPSPKEARDLHTSSKEEEAASYQSYQVRLLRLDPYPVSGKAIARRDYLATLEVTRASSAVAEHR